MIIGNFEIIHVQCECSDRTRDQKMDTIIVKIAGQSRLEIVIIHLISDPKEMDWFSDISSMFL